MWWEGRRSRGQNKLWFLMTASRSEFLTCQSIKENAETNHLTNQSVNQLFVSFPHEQRLLTCSSRFHSASRFLSSWQRAFCLSTSTANSLFVAISLSNCSRNRSIVCDSPALLPRQRENVFANQTITLFSKTKIYLLTQQITKLLLDFKLMEGNYFWWMEGSVDG